VVSSWLSIIWRQPPPRKTEGTGAVTGVAAGASEKGVEKGCLAQSPALPSHLKSVQEEPAWGRIVVAAGRCMPCDAMRA